MPDATKPRARPMTFEEQCQLCKDWWPEGTLREQRGIKVGPRCYDEKNPGDD